MILLAGPAATARTVSGEAVRVDDAERAAATLESGAASVLVLDSALPGAADLYGRLRAGELGRADRPVVLLGDETAAARSYDERLSEPIDESAFADAVERARTVVAYRDAVETLYDRCRERAAAGVADPLAEPSELADAREEADRALAALGDPSVVADLLDE